MNITGDVLRELGACGDPIEAFERVFPISEYPDGVAATVENCVKAVDEPSLSWGWAAERMLKDAAYNEFYEVTGQRGDFWRSIREEQREIRQTHDNALEAWREKYNEDSIYVQRNTSDEAKVEHQAINATYDEAFAASNRKLLVFTAETFGKFMEDPTNYREGFKSAVQAAERNADYNAERRVESAQHHVDNARRYIRDYTEALPNLEKELEAAEKVLKMRQERKLDRDLAAAQAELDTQKRNLEERQEKVAELIKAIADRDTARAAEADGNVETTTDANADAVTASN